MDTYRQAVIRLYDLQKFGIKLGLNSTELLLKRLGNPHLESPTIHVAGTNGKGSVGAMLEASLMEAGVKVGFYTSPHLNRFTERYKINGQEISQADVVKFAERAWQAVDDREPPTFFELVTAMAFDYFAESGVELAILETGMGGRLDATNICRPLATVITNIGLEHQEYLGATYRQIAYEKAGIIKPGVPLIHGVAQPTAREVVESLAQRRGAPVIRMGRDISFRHLKDGSFNLRGRFWELKHARTSLLGEHQASNACLALGLGEAMAEAGAPLKPEHMAAALPKTQWPGRLECLRGEPGQAAIWLDGAHNLHAAKILLANLEAIKRGRKRLVMVVGVMADKEVEKILATLLPPADQVIFSRPAYDRAASPQTLAEKRPPDCPEWQVVGNLAEALEAGEKAAGQDGVLLVTGSLFTVAEARAILRDEPISDLP